MAKGETLSGLYLRIGLNYSELNQDFVKVEETLQANMARLNRREQLINLRAKIDLSEATNSTEQLNIQQRKLQQIIAVTQERLKLYRAELQGTEQTFGATNKLTEQARIQVSKYELALARLTAELKNLENQQRKLSGENKLLEGYYNLKGGAAERLSALTNIWDSVRNSSTSASVAIESFLGVIGKVPLPVGVAVASIASIPIVTKAAENALLGLAEPAMSAGDALYVMGRGMQMNMEDTMKLATICKITGIQISEVAATLKRFNTRIMAATSVDDPRLKMLERYGAKIRDVNGHLKNNIEMSAELGRALKKAQAEGNGIAFRDVIFARYVSGDFITYLEDFADNYDLAKKIVKNKLADPAFAHAVQGNMNALNTQIDELKGVASMALLPAANEVIARLTEQFGKLTEVVAESKDGIMAFGSATAAVINNIGDITTAVTSQVIKLASAFSELFILQDKQLKKRYLKDTDNAIIAGKIPEELQKLTTLDDFVNKELQRNYTYTERLSIESNPELYKLARSRYQSQFDALMEKKTQLEKESALYIIVRNLQNDNIRNAKDLMNQELKINFSSEEIQDINANPARLEQTIDRYTEIFKKYDIVRRNLKNDKIRNGENLLIEEFGKLNADKLKENAEEYKKALEEYDEIFQLLEDVRKSANALPDMRVLKSEPIQTEEQLEAFKKTLAAENALSDELYKLTHNDNEGKKLDLLRWYDNLVNDENTTEKQRTLAYQVFLAKSEKLEKAHADTIQSIRDKVNAEFQSDIEKRIANIEKEKRAWIDAGMEEAEAAALAQRLINKAYEDREKNLDEIRDKVNALNRTELENKFIGIDRQRKEWQDIGMEESEATELAEKLKLDAVTKLEEEFSVALNGLRESNLEKELSRIEKERQAWIDKGIEETRATEYAEAAKAKVYEAQARRIDEIRSGVEMQFMTSLERQLAQIKKDKANWIETGMSIAEAEELTQQRILKVREEASQKARDLIQQTADIEYAMTHSAFEKQLRDIEQWKQAQIEKAETAEEVSAIIGNAAMKEADAFEREMDRIKGKLETLQDKIYAQEHSQYEVDKRRILKEQEKYYEEGIYPSKMIDRWAKNALREIDIKASKDKSGNYVRAPEGMEDGPLLVEFDDAVSRSSKSLKEMDASQLAAIATLKKAMTGMAELDKILNEGKTASGEYIKSADKTGMAAKASSMLKEKMAQIDRVTSQLSKADKSRKNNNNDAIVQNKKNLRDSPSALNTFKQALNEYMRILDKKPQVKMPVEEERDEPFPIYYGNKVPHGLGLAMATEYKPPSQDNKELIRQITEIVASADGIDKYVAKKRVNPPIEELPFPEANNIVQDLTENLMRVSEATGNIASAVSSTQKQSITVSPNINIDLGGAYVFDNSMKQQLVDDITSEVANAVTDAVSGATSQANYGYGN